MNSNPLLTGLLGALISAGLAGFVLSFLGHELLPHRETKQFVGSEEQFAWTRIAAGVVSFGLAILLIGHPVFAATAGLGTFIVWGQLGSKRKTKEHIARENAAVVWMEALAAALTHSHMNVAIASAGEYAEPEIRQQAQALTRNLQTMELEDAMRIFADEMNSRPIDGVAAVLTLVASHGGRKVGELILLEAAQAREYANAIGEIAQAQTNDRVTVRQVLAVTILMALGIPLLSDDVMAWYDTMMGHVALAVIGGGFLWCLSYMVVLSRTPTSPRFFLGNEANMQPALQAGADQ